MAAIPADASRPSTFTVTDGLDLFDEWSARATQAQKNIIHRVLFSVADNSVFYSYPVIDDVANHMEYFVLAKNDLAVKIRIDAIDAFSILYIGPSVDAPGLDPEWSTAISEDDSLGLDGDVASHDVWYM